ncbi:MAG: sensor histidine kinase [Clostridia bacterium]|nr:sensor histidine kinase [Clostridia bacterium]
MSGYLDTIFRYAVSGIETFLVVFIFVRYAEKRNAFVLRITLALLAITASALLFSIIPLIWSNAERVTNIVYFVYTCAFTYAAIYAIFNIGWTSLAFYSALAITAKLSANKVFNVLSVLLGEETFLNENVIWQVLHVCIIVIFYAFIYFVFVKKYNNVEQYSFDGEKYLLPLIIVVNVVLEVCEIFVAASQMPDLIGLYVCGMCYCGVMLFVEYSFVYKGKAKQEVSILKSIWEKDRKHYELEKENIDIVNMKCHDLRHQLRNMYQNGAFSKEEAEKIESSIHIYDSIANTENEVLDVVLSSFSLRCHKNNINLTYMVDGKHLKFMEEWDIYSLFGNMLENAFEYEQTVEPSENRFITLTIKEAMGFLSIQTKNFYTGKNLTSEEILTTKGDPLNHGFGIKSMKDIVKKYNGKFNIITEYDMFKVVILLPLSNENKESKT